MLIVLPLVENYSICIKLKMPPELRILPGGGRIGLLVTLLCAETWIQGAHADPALNVGCSG